MEHQLEELTAAINEELEQCDRNDTPAICKAIHTEKGKALIVSLVTKKVLGSLCSIGDAIIQVENEYDINTFID